MSAGDVADGRRWVGPSLFGRPGGPARFVLGVLGLIVLLTLTVTVARIDDRLGVLVGLNRESLDGARRIAGADDRLTSRLHQLTDLAEGAHTTLESTRALQPVLADRARPASTARRAGR
jgi:hypothetical protein